MNLLKLLLAILLSLFLSGCAEKTTVDHSLIPEHSHYYPYTKNLADEYHVRLEVDRNGGQMALIFEDVSENKVRLLKVKTINAIVFFPQGKTEKAIFRIVKKPFRSKHKSHPIRQLKKRRAGFFAHKANWIKTSPQFDVEVTFPFKGKEYNFVFNYKNDVKIEIFHRK